MMQAPLPQQRGSPLIGFSSIHVVGSEAEGGAINGVRGREHSIGPGRAAALMAMGMRRR
jgi:hypothetical protein